MSLSINFASLFLILHALALVVKAQNGGQVVIATQLWCVAKNNAEDAALQSALDWACGPGGSDCSLIQQGGPCYDPSDIQRTASYVFNDYYLKHGMTDDSCFFDNSAALTSLNPSFGSCKFPSSSSNNGNFSGSTTMGMGSDSADLNGCYQIGGGGGDRWVWFLISIHLYFVILHTIRVN